MEDRIKIWGKSVPFNTGKSKMEILDVHPEYHFFQMYLKHPGIFSRNTEYVEDMSGNDTVVYKSEIQTGYAKETFNDEPFLIPHLVAGSDRCIITVPGGGYLNKSMENEGAGIARFLNAAGISCFVLWYRSYPYLYPVPALDLQRAVRYVRFHAKEFGIHPSKIGVVGFSAGGNCCANLITILRNSPVGVAGYTPDEVDQTDATVALGGLIYPALDLENMKVFMRAFVPKEQLIDPESRETLGKFFTHKYHILPTDPAQFIAFANNDALVPPQGMREYFEALVDKDVPAKLMVFKKGGHGFGDCEGGWLHRLLTKEARAWKTGFSDWANQLFDRL